jgi:hypothetical protein
MALADRAFFLMAEMIICCRLARAKSDCCSTSVASRERASWRACSPFTT